MARIVTYDENGVSKIADYSNSKLTNTEIEKALHKDSYRKNLIKFLREQVNSKPLSEVSDNSLGYALETLVSKKLFSTVDRIEFHSHEKKLKNFGVR